MKTGIIASYVSLGLLLTGVDANAESLYSQPQPALRSVLSHSAAPMRTHARTVLNASVRPTQKVPDDGREYTTVIEEDFSLCTAGSPDNPDTHYIENADNTIPDTYTHTPGWSGRGIMQAGGAICIGKVTDPYTHQEMTGQIETPVLDLHRDNGKAYLSFRAKPLPMDVDMLTIRWVTPGDPLPVTGEEQTVYVHGAAWTTVNVDLTDCPEDAIIQIWSQYNEILIDDIKIEQYHAEIDAPKALKWTGYTGDSFTCNWSAVDGADHYILNVFYIRREGTEDQLPDYKYVVKNKSVTETSYFVDGLDPNKVYYYYVRAVNAAGVLSEESQVVEVLALTVPGGLNVDSVDKDGFTVSWNAVNKAEGYGFQAILTHTAPADEDYAILDENFDCIHSEGSVGDPYGNAIGYYDMDSYGMSRANWVMYEGGVIDGGICLHNYVSTYGEQYYGELVSPIITIGQSTGKITIEADYAATVAGMHPYVQIAVPGVVDGVTQWVLGAGGEIKENVGRDWTRISRTYEVPAGLVRISIGCNDGDWLYVDNLRISVELPKGAVQKLPYHYNEIRDALSYYCATPDRMQGDSYSFALMAAMQKPGSFMIPIYITSDWSDITPVPDIEWTGIADVRPDGSTFRACAADGAIAINNPEGRAFAVCDISGRRLASSTSAELTLSVPAGIYIVSAEGMSAVKVAVK